MWKPVMFAAAFMAQVHFSGPSTLNVAARNQSQEGVKGRGVISKNGLKSLLVKGECNRGCSCADLKGNTGDVGQKGELGFPGEDGTMGAQGIKGDTGNIGPPGETGSKGERGFSGYPGVSGPRGKAGLTGPQGQQGFTGPQGKDGPFGEKGEKGTRGPKGDVGPQGIHGMIGRNGRDAQPGSRGLPGVPGQRGLPGCDGLNGTEGPKGINGRKGENGKQGRRGRRGRKGIKGTFGAKGEPGPKGEKDTSIFRFLHERRKYSRVNGSNLIVLKDLNGTKGEHGRKGTKGLSGVNGTKGEHGRKGTKGLSGVNGTKGESGTQGPKGIPGEDGHNGEPGTPGLPGPTGYIYVRHSQATKMPMCKFSHGTLWKGFSLLHTEDEGRAQIQDLGLAGSCLKRFSPAPFLSCTGAAGCHYATLSTTSYWLSANVTELMVVIQNDDIAKHISRCIVCQAPGPVIAIHSQSRQTPDCPSGWTALWTGNSFVMHTVGSLGGGQPLASPGSCLEQFSFNPYIECSKNGQCHFSAGKFSYWLAAIPEKINTKPLTQNLKGDKYLEKISHCVVCMLGNK